MGDVESPLYIRKGNSSQPLGDEDEGTAGRYTKFNQNLFGRELITTFVFPAVLVKSLGKSGLKIIPEELVGE